MVKFSAIARVHVRLTFNPASTTALNASKTAAAPHLSKNILSIPPVGLIFKPPQSNTIPFPTKATIFSLSDGLP